MPTRSHMGGDVLSLTCWSLMLSSQLYTIFQTSWSSLLSRTLTICTHPGVHSGSQDLPTSGPGVPRWSPHRVLLPHALEHSRLQISSKKKGLSNEVDKSCTKLHHTHFHMEQEANFQKPPLTHLEPQLLGSRDPKQVHLFHHRDVAKAKNLGSDTALSRSPLNYDSKCTDYYFLYNSSQSSSGAWTQHIRKQWSNENRDTNNSKGELNTEENKLRKYKCVWRQSSGAMPLLEPPRLQSKPWPRTREWHRGLEPHLPVRKAQRVPTIWEQVAPPGQLDTHANYEGALN